GLYASAGASATARHAAWAKRLLGPTTNVSNVYRGFSTSGCGSFSTAAARAAAGFGACGAGTAGEGAAGAPAGDASRGAGTGAASGSTKRTSRIRPDNCSSVLRRAAP